MALQWGVAIAAPSFRNLYWLITLGRDIRCRNRVPCAQKSLPFTSCYAGGNTTKIMVMVPMKGATLTPSGMVMLLIPRVTVTLRYMGRILRASTVTFSAGEMTMNWPKCMGILLSKGPWLGFGFHWCPNIQGCFATCGTITETPSNCIRLFDRRDTPPWHWVKPTRSSNILPEEIFLPPFSSIPSGDSSLWLHGWALLPLPCYGAMWSTNMLRSHCWARPGVQYHWRASSWP